VVYFALEGGHGFRNRIEAYRRKHSVTSAPFFLITDRTNLIRDSGAMIAAIRAQIGLTAPVLVVIDTLNRSLVGSESEDRDMGAYIRAADEMRGALQCAVLIVHHCGVEGTRPRGHTSLTGAADAQIAISRSTAGIITAKVEFMKDGPEGCAILSQLDSVELGQDVDGDPVSSCVIVPVEGTAVSESKPAKLSNAAQIALRALAEAIDEQGMVPPASRHIPAGMKTVRIQAWRQQAYLRGISTGEQRAREQAFKRGSDQLIKTNRVGVWDEQVWLA
jgi:hypothetical protein